MKIAHLFIQDYGQFSDFQLDLTYPEGHPKAGQAMDRICLIGKNGAGKTRLMQLLSNYLRELVRFKSKQLFMVKLQIGDGFVYSVHLNNNVLFFRDTIDEEPTWFVELIRDRAFTMEFNRKYEAYCIGFEEEPELFDALWFDNNSDDVLIYQPADYAKNRIMGLQDVPMTKGHEAESLKHTFPFYNQISPEHASEFWALLIYLIDRRRAGFREFSETPENRVKPSSILEMMYEKLHPEVLPALAALWAPILDQVNAELNLEEADTPGHIKDRLLLYLKQKQSGERLDYGALGTGMQRLLFGLGHTWALFFDRQIQHGFCFLESPEAHLHPTLIKDLIPTYEGLIQGAQLFCSTHSPLVAQSFDPAERLILSRDEKGNIGIERSTAAAEAGLDEILSKDFV